MFDEAYAGWLRKHGAQAWRSMSQIRELESRLEAFTKAGHICGPAHPSVGMEAVPVGVSLHLTNKDFITSTHRGHAHCLAKGAEPGRVLAELFGRVDGYSRGNGGSMHLASKELGILGTNGIVGASIGLGTGAALTASIKGTGSIAVAYFGDGALNQGTFHESLNIAALWKLPVVYVCENNQFAQSTRIENSLSISNAASRAMSYGIPGHSVDGMDVYEVWKAMETAATRARAGEGPSLVVADTYRYLGHSVGDTEIYRTKQEVETWKGRDAIVRLENDLQAAAGFRAGWFDDERAQVKDLIDAAERFALSSPFPPVEQALQNVYGAR